MGAVFKWYGRLSPADKSICPFPHPRDGPQLPSPPGVPSLVTCQPKTSLRFLPKVRLHLGALASPHCHNVGPGTAVSSHTLPPPHLRDWWGLRRNFRIGQRRDCPTAGSSSQLLGGPSHRGAEEPVEALPDGLFQPLLNQTLVFVSFLLQKPGAPAAPGGGAQMRA